MTRELPPLNALRAFEAAARHLSFTKAAAELHVTPAAVGHQVKLLEEHLGVRLFQRLNRALVLTDAGQDCLPLVSEGLDRLAQAGARAQRHGEHGVLRVTVAPTLAVKWLVPRLPAFHAAHPELRLRIETAMEVVDLAREGVDLGIRFCAPPGAGLAGEVLFDEEVIAVCAPGLITDARPLARPDDLARHTLIHVDDETADRNRVDWADWLARAGATAVDASEGLRFTQTIVAAQAALDGQGVALLGRTCILDDLARGRLVQPFTLACPADYAFYLVAPAASFAQPKVAAFREWVMAAAAESLRAATAEPQ